MDGAGQIPLAPPERAVFFMSVPLLGQGPIEWYCPNCWVTVWQPPPPPGQAKFHTCPGLHMLTAPLIPVGTRCKVEAQEREEYLGREIQNKGDDGKPYMAVITTRDDGTDTVANAGCAQATLGALREMADE